MPPSGQDQDLAMDSRPTADMAVTADTEGAMPQLVRRPAAVLEDIKDSVIRVMEALEDMEEDTAATGSSTISLVITTTLDPPAMGAIHLADDSE